MISHSTKQNAELKKRDRPWRAWHIRLFIANARERMHGPEGHPFYNMRSFWNEPLFW
jgi:hypothetical protein